MQRILTDEQLETIRSMLALGKKNCEIAKALNLPSPTVSYWIRKERNKDNSKSKIRCSGCIYFGRHTKTCDYILITGKTRECEIEDCNKFKKGGYAGNDHKIGTMCISQKYPQEDFSKYIYSQALYNWEEEN